MLGPREREPQGTQPRMSRLRPRTQRSRCPARRLRPRSRRSESKRLRSRERRNPNRFDRAPRCLRDLRTVVMFRRHVDNAPVEACDLDPNSATLNDHLSFLALELIAAKPGNPDADRARLLEEHPRNRALA